MEYQVKLNEKCTVQLNYILRFEDTSLYITANGLVSSTSGEKSANTMIGNDVLAVNWQSLVIWLCKELDQISIEWKNTGTE